MTSGSGVNYKSMFDAGSQIVAKEGTKSLFKGAGANILRGVAGAGVLSLYDKLQQILFGKVYSGGTFSLSLFLPQCSTFMKDLVKIILFRIDPLLDFRFYRHHSLMGMATLYPYKRSLRNNK